MRRALVTSRPTVDLLVGGSATFIVDGTVAPGASGTIVNTATVDGAGERDGPRRCGPHRDRQRHARPTADLSITKTDGADRCRTGREHVTYTIVVTNAGPVVGRSTPLVADTFPAELTGVDLDLRRRHRRHLRRRVGDRRHRDHRRPRHRAGGDLHGRRDRSSARRPARSPTPRPSRRPRARPTRSRPTTTRPTPTRSRRPPTCRSPRPTGVTIGRPRARSPTRSSSPTPGRSVVDVDVDDTMPAALTGVTWTCTKQAPAPAMMRPARGHRDHRRPAGGRRSPSPSTARWSRPRPGRSPTRRRSPPRAASSTDPRRPDRHRHRHHHAAGRPHDHQDRRAD